MKQITALSLFVALLFTTHLNAQKSYWNGSGMNGEGSVVKKELKISNFEKIGLAINGTLILKQGNTQSVVIEGQQNIIDNIERDVNNKGWSIEFDKNVKKYTPVIIYVTVPVLESISLSGSGTIKCEDTFTGADEFSVGISGSGTADIAFEAETAKTSLSGSGNVKISGSCDTHKLSIAGSGTINAYDLQSNELRVSISGSGNANVHVKEKLKASIAGSGNVNYKGDPDLNSSIAGSGSVRSKG